MNFRVKCTCGAFALPLRSHPPVLVNRLRHLANSSRLREHELPRRPDPHAFGIPVMRTSIGSLPQMGSAKRLRNRNTILYGLAGAVFAVGLTYASVPLYRLFCAQTGFGGTPMTGAGTGSGQFAPQRMTAVQGPRVRPITVRFNADCSAQLPWSFKPVQRSITVRPGETALAFFQAKNTSKQDIIGIATYSVTPAQVCLCPLV